MYARISWLSVGMAVAISLLVACQAEKVADDKGKEKAAAGEGEKSAPDEAPAPTKLTEEQLTTWSTTDIEGFERKSQQVGGGNASIYYEGTVENAQGRRPSVQVVLGGCFVCEKMEVEKWRALKDNLMMMLSTATKEDPNLIFDIEALALGDGLTGITTYSRSYVESETPGGGKSRAANHGVTLYFNDSVNNLVITVSGRGKPGEMAQSAEELATVFTKDEMLEAAKKVFVAFVPVFAATP